MNEDLYARLDAIYNNTTHAEQSRLRDELEEYQPLREAFAHIFSACPRLSENFYVLDAGCGTGRYFHLVRDANLLVGSDISFTMLDKARSPYMEASLSSPPALVVGDLLFPAFRDESFDLVFSIGVFGQELPLDEKILNSLLRLTKPGGRLVLSILSSENGYPRISYYSPMSTDEVDKLMHTCGVDCYYLQRLHFCLASINSDEIFHALIIPKPISRVEA